MKRIRLPDYDYSGPGYYFLTVCTKDKAPILSEIAGHALPGVPMGVHLSEHGEIAEQQLLKMEAFYEADCVAAPRHSAGFFRPHGSPLKISVLSI